MPPPLRPPPACPRPRNDSRKAPLMSISRKIAHKAQAVKGSCKKTAGGSPAAGACAPKAALTRPRATSNRPGRKSRTPSSANPCRAGAPSLPHSRSPRRHDPGRRPPPDLTVTSTPDQAGTPRSRHTPRAHRAPSCPRRGSPPRRPGSPSRAPQKREESPCLSASEQLSSSRSSCLSSCSPAGTEPAHRRGRDLDPHAVGARIIRAEPPVARRRRKPAPG